MKLLHLRAFTRLRIPHRLALGFGLLVAIFLAYGLYAVSRTTTLADQTAELYAHPLAVQRAVLEAELAIVKMHRAMKDVSLAPPGCRTGLFSCVLQCRFRVSRRSSDS